MTVSKSQSRWIPRLAEQFDAFDDVETEALDDGRVAVRIVYEGRTADTVLVRSDSDYRTLKDFYTGVCNTISGLGIEEGAHYVPPPPPKTGRPATPQMRAARERKRLEYEAWQELWRTLRKGEAALEVDYEIAQMKDYY